jgi:predicted heme/steroid binding protein
MTNFRRIFALSLAAMLLFLLPATLAQTAAQPAGITARELAQFDGKDGRAAYIAVDGIVYDVTNHPAWQGGAHKGIEAGKDVTEAFAKSPHQADILATAPQVGALLLELSLDELAQFDGKEDRAAYVAADGLIYDVSEAKAYFSGEHGGLPAGTDITEAIKAAGHGENPLAKRPVVGRLVVKLTLDELSQYTGENGMRAYVAVDGVVYDVTDSRAWREGKHNGFQAGRDLTREIKEVSPHGPMKLENVPAVGIIVE